MTNQRRAGVREAAKDEAGLALVICVVVMLLMLALGGALIVATSTETTIAGNFETASEARAAAAAIVERALSDLRAAPDWTPVIGGLVQSGFVDGSDRGVRVLPDGSTLDLRQLVSVANCGKPTPCSDAQMDASTAARPWGANNPRWRLFAYGLLRDLLAPGSITSSYYVTLLVADDQGENDGNPLVDGSAGNPGAGVIVLRGESFGPRKSHQGVEATIARSDVVRMLSWRELPRLDRP